MDVMKMLLILPLVLSTPALAVFRRFHLVNLEKTWTEAQSYCKEKFFELASIETADESATVNDMVGNSGQPAAWIGMYDDSESWRWSLDNTSLYERDLGSWFIFAADNFGGDQHCGFVSRGLDSVGDFPCDSALKSVCFDETSNSYIPRLAIKTWKEAQRDCRETYTDLASIRNQQEWDDVRNAIQVAGGYWWIGLSRESWKWSGESNSTLRLWRTDEPSGGKKTCVASRVDGWDDMGCNSELPFICIAPQHKVLKVMLKTDESLNLNDPLVKDAVLNQMDKNLRKDETLNKFNLRWKTQPNGDVFNKTEL